jgi:phage repressor protein C with HTH and peptisase S24 domain
MAEAALRQHFGPALLHPHQGDSMSPSLSDFDDILVEQGIAIEQLRDGIYLLRRDDTLMVKRIALSPTGKHVTIKSDNPTCPEWRDCDLNSLQIIGRVIWAGAQGRLKPNLTKSILHYIVGYL